MPILNSPPRLAKLLASMKVPGTSRPLSPVDVANEINEMRKDLGGNHDELVRRLPIGRDMTNQYLCLLKLPPQVQGMVVWGESKRETSAIGFSVASRIASLDDPGDRLKVISAVAEMQHPVTKEEIGGILSLKKSNPSKPIEECLSEVLNVTRPVVITHHVFLSGLDPVIAESIKRRAHERSESANCLASRILRKAFPGDSLKGVRVFSDCIRLSLTRKGAEFIPKYSKSHDVPMQETLNHMLGSDVLTRD